MLRRHVSGNSFVGVDPLCTAGKFVEHGRLFWLTSCASVVGARDDARHLRMFYLLGEQHIVWGLVEVERVLGCSVVSGPSLGDFCRESGSVCGYRQMHV